MFLKALKQKLKQKSARKYVKQLLSGPIANTKKGHGIASVGCIVDLDKFEDVNLFYQLVDEFKLRPNSVKIIGYKSFYDKNSPYATPVFSDKDLGWNGAIENGYALEFLSREYDVLLNYYSDEQLLLQLMSYRYREVLLTMHL